jgi:hypothetical protein
MSPGHNPQSLPGIHPDDLIDYVRSEAAIVMEEIDSGRSNVRGSVYRLAQVSIILADLVAELIRADAASKAGARDGA